MQKPSRPQRPAESPMASSAPAPTPPDLPFRAFYEEIHPEAIETLKQELIDGMRMDIKKRFKEKFHISHSMVAGNTVIPSKLYKIVKTPTIYYDFGAGYTSSKSMLLAKMTMDGRLSAEFKYDFTHNLALKANAHLTDEHKSHGFINFDYKRSYDRFLFQMESGALLGAAYIVNVNPYISIGQEVLWACERRLPDFGFVFRYHSAKTTAIGHFRNTGMIGLSYVHRVSKEVSLASNFMCNTMSKDVIASVGYDCNTTPQSRVRGKIDSKGVVSVLIETLGTIIYSFEFDHNNRDYKLGFGLKFSDSNSSKITSNL